MLYIYIYIYIYIEREREREREREERERERSVVVVVVAPISLCHGGPAPKSFQRGSHMSLNCPRLIKLVKLQVIY